MDYGQTNQHEVNQPFFTEGVGNQSVEYTATPSREQNQNFGHNAINGQLVENPNPESVNLEAFAPTPEMMQNMMAPEMPGPDFGPEPEPLGQITEVEPAPAAPAQPAADFAYDSTAIKVEGDSLNSEAVNILTDNENTLKKTGDAASFLNTLDSIKEDNLKNSYNRTFGAS